jgi:hypothetical protein
MGSEHRVDFVAQRAVAGVQPPHLVAAVNDP